MPASASLSTLCARTAPVSPCLWRRSLCPTMPIATPSSARLAAETSPVNAPSVSGETSCAARETPVPASALYAWAALDLGLPYVNFTPSLGASFPAALELAEARKTVTCGKDGKTGETLMKTVLAPMFALVGLAAWVVFGFRLGEEPHFADESHFSALGHLLHELIEEGKRVAAAAGIKLHEDPWEMNKIGAMTNHPPSMLYDVRHQLPTEVDFLSGAIAREAERAGAPAPLHTAVYRLIKAKEASWTFKGENREL